MFRRRVLRVIGNLGATTGHIASAIKASLYGGAKSVRRGKVTVRFRDTQRNMLAPRTHAIRFELRALLFEFGKFGYCGFAHILRGDY